MLDTLIDNVTFGTQRTLINALIDQVNTGTSNLGTLADLIRDGGLLETMVITTNSEYTTSTALPRSLGSIVDITGRFGQDNVVLYTETMANEEGSTRDISREGGSTRDISREEYPSISPTNALFGDTVLVSEREYKADREYLISVELAFWDDDALIDNIQSTACGITTQDSDTPVIILHSINYNADGYLCKGPKSVTGVFVWQPTSDGPLTLTIGPIDADNNTTNIISAVVNINSYLYVESVDPVDPVDPVGRGVGQNI